MIPATLPDGLSARQESAIAALMNEPNVLKAAKACKVGHRTLHRWLHEPIFQRAYREVRREAFGQAVSFTQRYAPLAVQTLAKIMLDSASNQAVKVTAASALLRFGRESIELDDLLARIEHLEAKEPKGTEKVSKYQAPKKSFDMDREAV